MKIDDSKNQFLNYLVENRGRSPNTKKAYDYDLTRFIQYLNRKAICRLVDVKPITIEAYLSLNQSISAVTKARIRSSIKSFFSYLTQKGILKANPASELESIKLPEKYPAYLSNEQRILFLKTISRESTPYYRERDLMLANLLFMTGLRRSEIISLNVGDIDLSRQVISVKRKGNHMVNVNIHDELVGDLKKYLLGIHRNTDAPVFMSKRGNRLSASALWHLVKNYSRKAGLSKSVTVHSLRHTFATTMLSNGMSLPFIQELMGHKSSETTARYLHFHNPDLILAFNKTTFEERK